MAKASIILLMALLLAVSVVEGGLFGIGSGGKKGGKAAATLQCEDVVSVGAGDTCFGITQTFKLTAEEFTELNPNLVCEKLFVGQWICTRGESSS